MIIVLMRDIREKTCSTVDSKTFLSLPFLIGNTYWEAMRSFIMKPNNYLFYDTRFFFDKGHPIRDSSSTEHSGKNKGLFKENSGKNKGHFKKKYGQQISYVMTKISLCTVSLKI